MENTDKEIPEGFTLLSEGKANILYHEKEGKAQAESPSVEEVKDGKKKQGKMKKEDKDENRDTVFYNPVQEFNRDISIL
jgi:tRNA G26 N,N-dimethylase Trm1